MSELCQPEDNPAQLGESSGLQDEPPLLPAVESRDVTPAAPATSSHFSLIADTSNDEAVPDSPPLAPQGSLCASPTPGPLATVPSSPPREEAVNDQREAELGALQEPAGAQAMPVMALQEMMSLLVQFLLAKYRAQEPASQAEMLHEVLGGEQELFARVFHEACLCIQVVFGLDVTEVEPDGKSYVLSITLGLTYDGLQSPEETMPKTGLLVIVLGLILLHDDMVTEEYMWEALSVMGLYPGSRHSIYGEPRELLTQVWVREHYLLYQQVPGSDPASYVFLWGPRAHMETSKICILERFLEINSLTSIAFVRLTRGALPGEVAGP